MKPLVAGSWQDVTDAGIVKSKQLEPCASAISIQSTWDLWSAELRSYRGGVICAVTSDASPRAADAGWARDAPTPVGLWPRSPSSSLFPRLCAKGASFFLLNNCHGHFAGVEQTLTVHAHGHGALHGYGDGAVASVALKRPAVVRAQSSKPAMDK